MNQAEKERLEKRLNQLGTEWGALPETGEEARRASLQSDIFLVIYTLYPDPKWADAINSLFLKDWKNFDPSKASLSKFISSRMKHRMEDARQENSMTKTRQVKGEKVKITPISIHTSGQNPDGEYEGNGNPIEIPDPRPTSNPGEPSDPDRLDETSIQLLTTMMKLMQHMEDNSDTKHREKLNYFRLFYTGGIVDFLHPLDEKGNVMDTPDIYFDKEQEVFEVMKLRFLDFVMTKPCRTLLTIQRTEIKNYDQMVEGRPPERPPQPFLADIYYTYLTKVENHASSDSAVSNQRKTYRKFLVEAGIRTPSTKNYTAKKLSKL